MIKKTFDNRNPASKAIKAAVSALAVTILLAACDAAQTPNSADSGKSSGTENRDQTTKSLPVFAAMKPYNQRPITDDIIYFMLPDRFANGDPANDTGGYAGGRLDHGLDPTDKGFYHGGDLKGVMNKLDYLENMGVTAIWMAPIFKNKPV